MLQLDELIAALQHMDQSAHHSLAGLTAVHLQCRNAGCYWTQQLQKMAAASHKCGQAWIDKSHVSLIQQALCSQESLTAYVYAWLQTTST